MLRIYLLGPFRVEHNGQSIPPQEWARPKDRSLLKLLALERGHLVPQDRLLDLLWPDLTPAAAANNLHVAVSRLRKVLDPLLPSTTSTSQVIRREEAGYTLPADTPVWTDLEEFRRRLGQGREWRRRGAWAPAVSAYRAAEELYRGDLFEEDPYRYNVSALLEHLREPSSLIIESIKKLS